MSPAGWIDLAAATDAQRNAMARILVEAFAELAPDAWPTESEVVGVVPDANGLGKPGHPDGEAGGEVSLRSMSRCRRNETWNRRVPSVARDKPAVAWVVRSGPIVANRPD